MEKLPDRQLLCSKMVIKRVRPKRILTKSTLDLDGLNLSLSLDRTINHSTYKVNIKAKASLEVNNNSRILEIRNKTFSKSATFIYLTMLPMKIVSVH